MKETLYTELLKYTLTDYHRIDDAEYRPISSIKSSVKVRMLLKLDKIISVKGFTICKKIKYSKENRLKIGLLMLIP